MADARDDAAGVFADKYFVWAMSKLVGSDVEVLTTDNERISGILDTFNRQSSVVLKTVQQAADSEPKIITIVIERKHLISLKGKFSNDPSRLFLDHAIASNVQVNGLNEDASGAFADLVPWEDDDSTSDGQTNLVLEENEPGWDSSNMISTFEKANPGKTSYLGMEQYTNVEVPDLSENEVREISQIADQAVPIDDDYKEDETRTEEEKFAAVERCNTQSATESGNESNKSRHLDEKKELRSSQNSYTRGSESLRRKERYSTRSMNFSRRVIASPSSLSGDRDYSGAYPESQSARSSPYLKLSSPQSSTNYFPRRAGRGSLRYPGGRSRYRGHPSLPIEIPRVPQQNASYYYNKSAKQSPAWRYDIEAYDRQTADVTRSRQRVPSSASDRTIGGSGSAVCGLQMEASSKRLESTAPVSDDSERTTKADNPQDNSSAEVSASGSALSDVVKHSQLNPMASAYVPQRHGATENIPPDANEHIVNSAAPSPAVLPPFAIGPLLQALPAAHMAPPPIAQFAPIDPLGRGYDAGIALAAQFSNAACRRDIDGNRPRKAIVSVNMPVVENPFLMRPIYPQSSAEQERKSRRFVLTSNETSTTIQVPSSGVALDNAETGPTSTEQQSQDATDGVVMANAFSPQPQMSPKEATTVYTQLPSPAAFTVMPSGQPPTIAAPNAGISYTPAYYVFNPAALTSPGIITAQPGLYQPATLMQPYPFCGYQTTPISFLPFTGAFATANALQGQDTMMEQTQRRSRLSYPGGGRFSESVSVGSRSSQGQQDSARLDVEQKTSAADNRRGGEEGRRKANSALSDGDSRRFANRRRYDGGNPQSRHGDHPPDHQGRRGSSLQHYSQSRHEHFKRNR